VNAPIAWWWPVLAAVATAVAVLAGADYALAVPAATVAVAAAALSLLGPLVRRREERVRTPYLAPIHAGSVREAFTGGTAGWEDIVLQLDLLERKVARPNLPIRTGPEIKAIVRQPPETLRRYVARRLDELESRS
jgi:hypothetical protein